MSAHAWPSCTAHGVVMVGGAGCVTCVIDRRDAEPVDSDDAAPGDCRTVVALIARLAALLPIDEESGR